MAPVSKDTLLKAVRPRSQPNFIPPRFVEIDDWAWQRNHRYPALLTVSKRIQYDGYIRREGTRDAILKQSKNGLAIEEIVRRTGHS